MITSEQALWDALQSSDLGGTRWQPEAVSLPDVAVHPLTEASSQDAGAGLWAEMHFYRTGGAVISVRVRPALGHEDDLPSALWIGMDWAEDNGEMAVEMLRPVGSDQTVRTLLKEAAVTYDGDTVTFVLADGTQAVFRKK